MLLYALTNWKPEDCRCVVNCCSAKKQVWKEIAGEYETCVRNSRLFCPNKAQQGFELQEIQRETEGC
jgi:hypothetical protein